MTVGRQTLTVLLITVVMASATVNAEMMDGREACQEEYDVVVLLDRSKKVGEEKFTSFIQLIKNILPLFNIGEDGNHFGLVLYNNKPDIAMKLTDNNSVSFIENYLMNGLPRREGGRDAERALRKARKEILTTAMGDRPGAPNVCLVLTTQYGVRRDKQFTKIKPLCKFFFVLRNGGDADLQKVHDKVCAKEEPEVSSRCPSSYTLVADKYCFTVIETNQLFSESLLDCQERNGSLVKIDTEEKNVALLQYIDSLQLSPTLLWIGLNDPPGDDTVFEWVSDGSLLSSTYSNFTSDQSGNTLEQCAVINLLRSPHIWFVALCTGFWNAICEN